MLRFTFVWSLIWLDRYIVSLGIRDQNLRCPETWFFPHLIFFFQLTHGTGFRAELDSNARADINRNHPGQSVNDRLLVIVMQIIERKVNGITVMWYLKWIGAFAMPLVTPSNVRIIAMRCHRCARARADKTFVWKSKSPRSVKCRYSNAES